MPAFIQTCFRKYILYDKLTQACWPGGVGSIEPLVLNLFWLVCKMHISLLSMLKIGVVGPKEGSSCTYLFQTLVGFLMHFNVSRGSKNWRIFLSLQLSFKFSVFNPWFYQSLHPQLDTNISKITVIWDLFHKRKLKKKFIFCYSV